MFENGNRKYIKDTTTRTKEQTTAEGHLLVLNAARKSRGGMFMIEFLSFMI